jgi:uncharacterized damage-inducible protein DinB
VDYFFLIERHLQPMLQIVDGLGDELANTVPDLPGANSPYQIVFHSCGMLEWWTREAMLGVPVGRDRDAEFTATGTVDGLHRRVDQVSAQFRRDLEQIDLDAPLRTEHAGYTGTPISGSARGAMMHVFEELAQHHGQLEVTRDVLLTRRESPRP